MVMTEAKASRLDLAKLLLAVENAPPVVRDLRADLVSGGTEDS
jgi:hypothetical protein